MMKLLTDECVDNQIVDALRLAGQEVIYVAEMSKSISDDDVIQLANVENAILMTEDKDFGELIYRLGRISRGVILVRLHGLDNAQKDNVVEKAIKQHQTEFPLHFSVVSAFALINPFFYHIATRLLESLQKDLMIADEEQDMVFRTAINRLSNTRHFTTSYRSFGSSSRDLKSGRFTLLSRKSSSSTIAMQLLTSLKKYGCCAWTRIID